MKTAAPILVYRAAAVFLITIIVAALLQLWWLVLAPLGLLVCIWAFEKPERLLYLLLAAVPWSTEYQLTASLGTDFPDEPLMWLNALAVIFLLAYQPKRWRNALTNPVLLLLLAQVLWAALLLFTSTQLLLSIKYLLAKSWYLLALVLLPLCVWHKTEKLKRAAMILLASMLLLVFVTIVRHAVYGFTFASINASLAPFFRNHVNYSALLVCMLPLLWAFEKNATTRLVKNGLRLLLFLTLAALFFSYARGAWAAAIAGVIAYGLLKKKALFFSFLVTVMLIVASVFWMQQNNRYLQYAPKFNSTIFHPDFAEHLVATYELKDMSTAERFYRWIAGARMVPEHWLTGFGPNTFYNNYRSYTIPLFKTWVSANEEHSTVHNYFLLLLVEQGVIGLLLFLTLLGVAFYTAEKCYHQTKDRFWKEAVAVVAVILVMIATVNFLSDLIETDKVGTPFYLCVTVLMLARQQVKKETLHAAAHLQGIA